MAKIETLQRMISEINKKIHELNELIDEKIETIQRTESQISILQENLKADKSQMEEYQKQLTNTIEMKKETDGYYKQIEQNIDTLMTILTTSRS
jgi:chromosome segregation ATPase